MRRYEAVTGRLARLAGTGEGFEAVAEARASARPAAVDALDGTAPAGADAR